MRISVIVPVAGDDRLPGCLAALARQTVERSAYEILVADDAASEETRRLASAAGAVYLRAPGRGAYAARNAGARHARGDVLKDDPIGLLVQAVDDLRWAELAREASINYCDTRNLAGHRDLFLREPFDETFHHGGDLADSPESGQCRRHVLIFRPAHQSWAVQSRSFPVFSKVGPSTVRDCSRERDRIDHPSGA